MTTNQARPTNDDEGPFAPGPTGPCCAPTCCEPTPDHAAPSCTDALPRTSR